MACVHVSSRSKAKEGLASLTTDELGCGSWFLTVEAAWLAEREEGDDKIAQQLSLKGKGLAFSPAGTSGCGWKLIERGGGSIW